LHIALPFAEMTRSSVGCVYYAIDMDNYPGYEHAAYAVGDIQHAFLAFGQRAGANPQRGTWQAVDTRTVVHAHCSSQPDGPARRQYTTYLLLAHIASCRICRSLRTSSSRSTA
jgi:hypothetical protein